MDYFIIAENLTRLHITSYLTNVLAAGSDILPRAKITKVQNLQISWTID